MHMFRYTEDCRRIRIAFSAFVIQMFIMVTIVGCVSDAPRLTKVNGVTVVQTDRRLCGIRVWTSEKETKTFEQAKEDLAIQKAEAEQEIELKRKKQQQAMATWAGAGLMALALAAAIMGYVSQGWKFWGGIAAFLALLGSLSWGFAHWIPYLKWLVIPVVVLGIGKTLRDSQNFSLIKWLQRGKS